MLERSSEGCRLFVFTGAGLLAGPCSRPATEQPDGIPVISKAFAVGAMNRLENSA
jgi:hypothetical protein